MAGVSSDPCAAASAAGAEPAVVPHRRAGSAPGFIARRIGRLIYRLTAAATSSGDIRQSVGTDPEYRVQVSVRPNSATPA